MKLTRNENTIIVSDYGSGCDSLYLSIKLNCCDDSEKTCTFYKEYKCSWVFQFQKDAYTTIDYLNDDIGNNILSSTYAVHPDIWNTNDYAAFVQDIEEDTGLSVEMNSDDEYLYLILTTGWVTKDCAGTYNYTLGLSNDNSNTSLLANKTYETRLNEDCDWVSFDDNDNIVIEAQNEGIYSISVTCTIDKTKDTQSGCIALIDSLKCEIVNDAIKEQNKTSFVELTIYDALVNADGCVCSCDKMCEMYQYLLELLGKLNSGCYEQ